MGRRVWLYVIGTHTSTANVVRSGIGNYELELEQGTDNPVRASLKCTTTSKTAIRGKFQTGEESSRSWLARGKESK